MARFAAGARRVVVRAVAIGALVAAGWLLALVFGMLTAAPAAADSTAATGAAESSDATPAAGSVAAQHGLTAPVRVSASDNAEAMAGRTVDGLNSQRDPGLPAPSSAGKILDTDGLVPNGGGSGPFGPATGDAVRSGFDPRLQAGRAPVARLLPPVVRTAADDPSFSPD
jgi:pyruvate/2-oxoglutarate dehydrogenase complex dihydrolipoamide acyltransferase (E2) component